jgi:hypothetical protein
VSGGGEERREEINKPVMRRRTIAAIIRTVNTVGVCIEM